MRIRTIRTERLFGIFNHEIPLNTDDRITIIHGPNGYGKTAILRLVSDIFELRHTAVRQLPFASIALDFDDGTTLTVRKYAPADDGRERIVYECSPHADFVLPEQAQFDQRAAAIERHVPNLRQVDVDAWRYDYSGEVFTSDEVFERFSNLLPPNVVRTEYPEWLISLGESLDVHFVRATRLESASVSVAPRVARRRRARFAQSVVTSYAEELADRIRGTLAQYAELSQSLDRSFPRRLVAPTSKVAMTMTEIRSRLGELETKRNRLTEAGLLDKEAESRFDVASIDANKADVLSLYIEDVEQKLAVFDDIYARIDLLKTILNRRFSFKSVSINKADGIEFRTPDGLALAPEHLSSGEQHEVVLLYQLLFKVKTDSLILIDEPELSLHIAWQEQFLQDLLQITSLSEFNVLIATHSPHIISDRWDLTVELRGPDECASTSPATQLQIR